MASEESFSRVLRGYDPAEVDPLVQKLRRELLAAKTLHDETLSQLKELENRLVELENEVGVNTTPTVEGLSTKLNTKLKKADKLAAQIVRQAESEALLIRSSAEKTSNQFIDAAREGYEQAHKNTIAHTAELEKQARASAEDLLTQAREQARSIIAEAQTNAQQLRGEAATVAANLRAESNNEVARLKAEAHREIEELKLILLKQNGSAVNDEIMRIFKLNADGAAIRTEMEAELQERHQQSVMQTEKYVGSAETQLASSRNRQRTIEAEIEAKTRAAADEARLIVDKAQAKAAKELESSEKLARKKIADAEKYVAAVISTIYTQLETVRVEREAVSAYFDALRLELEQNLGDSSVQKKLTP